MLITEHPRQAWTEFRRPGRLTALAAAALVVISLGILTALGHRVSCDGPCPVDPIAADGSTVSDQFFFYHRDLGSTGSITARLTSMTGTITYPPPDHDRIVPGLVPWAKAGIIVKDGLRQGSSYAALMLTGHHGVRMQHDYRYDVAGRAGEVTAGSPVWLRLTRAGNTITGYESSDGRQWSTVGTTVLDGLPDTVQVGLFATSPGDLSLQRVGLGGAVQQSRFTQASGVFDTVGLDGAKPGAWRAEAVGEMNHTDWEKHHNPSGAVEANGTITVSGTGDIGPMGDNGGIAAERLLLGLTIALLIVLVVAARFGATNSRPAGATNRRPADVRPVTRRVLGARAVVVGTATFVTGVVAVGIAIAVGVAIFKHNGVPIIGVSVLTGFRVVVGVATVLALAALLAFGLGALMRRAWAAIMVATALIALPYALAALPLLPDAVAQWLLRVTPAAGFAVQQTVVEYPQVLWHYAPSEGYFPLPGWAGLAVLGTYTAVVMAVALHGRPSGDGAPPGPFPAGVPSAPRIG
ncbi:MAG TPA: hypothetical protein VF657_01470 [Actinoplanes sp.]